MNLNNFRHYSYFKDAEMKCVLFVISTGRLLFFPRPCWHFEFKKMLYIDDFGYKKVLSEHFKNSLVIHEGNTKQISTMTVTLYLIKLIDIRKILYKIVILISNWMRKQKQPITDRFWSCSNSQPTCFIKSKNYRATSSNF